MISAQELGKFNIFRGLNNDRLNKISGLCDEVHIEAGVKCFTQGDQAKKLYLCVDGAFDIKFWLREPWGVEVTIDTLKNGDAFGLDSLIAPYIYTNTAKCVNKALAVTINSVDLLDLFKGDPRTGYIVFNNLIVELKSMLHQDQYKITSNVPYPLSMTSGETEEELIRTVHNLLDEGESTNVIFKKQLNLSHDGEKTDFIRDILGLANTKSSGRRFMVIGFDNSTRSFNQSVNTNLTQGFLEQTLEAYAEPAPKIIYKNIPLASGTIETIEVIREGKYIPYRVKKELGGSEGIKGSEIYVRHGSITEAPTAREIEHLV